MGIGLFSLFVTLNFCRLDKKKGTTLSCNPS